MSELEHKLQKYIKARREELKHPEDCSLSSALLEFETALEHIDAAIDEAEKLERKNKGLRGACIFMLSALDNKNPDAGDNVEDAIVRMKLAVMNSGMAEQALKESE